MAEALQAKRTASGSVRPSERATTSAPLNTSPAAVVSTACVLYAGTISQCPVLKKVYSD